MNKLKKVSQIRIDLYVVKAGQPGETARVGLYKRNALERNSLDCSYPDGLLKDCGLVRVDITGQRTIVVDVDFCLGSMLEPFIAIRTGNAIIIPMAISQF